MYTNLILTGPLIFPLLLAITLMAFWTKIRWQRWINIAGSGFFLIISLLLFQKIYSQGICAVQVGEWPAPYGITLVADMLSAIMVMITALMAFAIAIYSLTAMDTARERFAFYPLLNIMYMGICGSFLTGDIFNLFVWFEVMLISSFVLLSLGSTRPQLEGTIKYVTLNLFSSIIFLIGIGMLYGVTGTLNFADLAVQVQQLDNTAMITVIAMLFIICFGIKSSLFPLFFWLPASYHTPPVTVSAIFAGLLTKVGVYALIRVFTLIFVHQVEYTHTILLIIAGFTMVIGVLGAAAQDDMRRILSFHIISQIGYMIMGLALFTPLAVAGAVFYIVHHIIVKTNLFLVSGVVNHLRGTYNLKKLGGFANAYPLLSILFLIPAFSLAGLPPLSGFWSKFLVIKAGLEVGEYIIVFVALAVGVLTLFSMTKIWNEVFWKAPPQETKSEKPVISLFSSQMLPLILPVALLASITLIIGFFPGIFFEIAEIAGKQLTDPTEYIEAVLGKQK